MSRRSDPPATATEATAPEPAAVLRRCRGLQRLTLLALAVQLLVAGWSALTWAAWLLLLLAGLKWRESRRKQDLQHGTLIHLVLVGLLAVLAPGLAAGLLQAGTALLALYGLLVLENGWSGAGRRPLTLLIALLAGSVPLMVLLFLFAPRLGPTAALPGGGMGRTGLAAELDPGAISELVQDPSPAMRIAFLRGGPPPPAERYWRVLTLDGFDGRRWQPRRAGARSPTGSPGGPRPGRSPSGDGADQLWTVEPSPLRQLPWPGRGRPLTGDLTVNDRGELIGPWAGQQRRRYALATGADGGPGAGAGADWRRTPPVRADLALPPGANPRLEVLGARWARTRPPLERLRAGAALFRGEPFRYTLQPAPLPDRAPLDGFLFDTREGFCEHYASAYSALMRAAGLPSRVVLGYQGGTWLPEGSEGGQGGGLLDVRQRDAHAWSEVWLPGRGWIRVDPTAFVAPERVERGVGEALESAGERALLGRRAAWQLGLERRWWRLEGLWNRWVVGLDGRSRQELMAALLGRHQAWQGLILIGGLALAGTLATLGIRRLSGPEAHDRPRRDLERLLGRLAPHGLAPAAGESLEHFCDRIGRARPALAEPMRRLAESYMRLRCGRAGRNPASLRLWQASCRNVRRQLDADLRDRPIRNMRLREKRKTQETRSRRHFRRRIVDRGSHDA